MLALVYTLLTYRRYIAALLDNCIFFEPSPTHQTFDVGSNNTALILETVVFGRTGVPRSNTRHSRLVDQVFDKANRPRVLRRNFARLREAVAIRKWKRGAKATADAVATLSLQRRMFRSLRQGVAVAAASRARLASAVGFAVRRLIMRGWENLRNHPAEKKVTSPCDTGSNRIMFGWCS